jgi:hypothetical protein
MLSWRAMLSGFKAVDQQDINILGYVDLFESRDIDMQFLEDSMPKK